MKELTESERDELTLFLAKTESGLSVALNHIAIIMEDPTDTRALDLFFKLRKKIPAVLRFLSEYSF